MRLAEPVARSAADGGHGNCEVALIRRGSADQVRAPFLTSGLELIDVGTANLHDLTFDDDDPAASRPAVALRQATWLKDGRIALVAEPPPETGHRLAWADGQAMLDGLITNEVLTQHERPPLLAWLSDEAGEAVSNAVAIDDPNALDRSLAERDSSRNRPHELQEQDAETPLGRIVNWLHQQCIFDIDDTPAARRTQSAQNDAPEEENTDFWDRLMADELSYDPRTANYPGMTSGLKPIGHDLFRELEIMLAMAPRNNPLLRLVSGDSASKPQPEGEHIGTSWSLEARQRGRVVNVLSRWCRAISDPRHALLRPDAPAANYQALLSVLVTAWVEGAIDEDRLIRLAAELFGAFLGDGRSPGFLGRADQDLREMVLRHLDRRIREWAAGIAYLALRPERPWKDVVYDWQPYLNKALIDTDVMIVGDQTAALASRITGRKVPVKEIEDVLIARTDYLDEKKWCENLARTLGLPRIELKLIDNKFVPLRISLKGVTEPLTDPRVVEAAMQAIITAERLVAVESQGGALSELLGLQSEVA